MSNVVSIDFQGKAKMQEMVVKTDQIMSLLEGIDGDKCTEILQAALLAIIEATVPDEFKTEEMADTISKTVGGNIFEALCSEGWE